MQTKNEFDLSGKIAVVTGAGRGLGYAISIALARYGAHVVACSRTESELKRVAGEIEKIGQRSIAVRLDVSDIGSIRPMVDRTLETFGRIDILVNNAGINRPQPAMDVTEENWDLVMNTNLKGLFFCAQAVGRVMVSQKKGKIINISSDAGTVGIPQRAVYCASKGGVNLLTKVLAIELAPHGIHVNAIAPAFIETSLTSPMLKEPEFKAYVLSNTPLGRVGKPAEVGAAAVFLASAASDYMTGHIMLVDGGWTAH
ncbi:MAG: glucose 1-dehydrogenase [Desulfobacteraceae bacterium]|nr:MAG: glucose 1-dehydrogenase [Desulfobacteraceae bacterium]